MPGIEFPPGVTEVTEMAESFPFNQVFRGLSSGHLPDFDYLLNLKVKTRGSPEELENERRANVGREMKAIHEVCAPHGFLPLVSELALIADIRLYRDERRDPFFTSIISVFLEPAASISGIYLDALRFMGKEEAGGVQIVPHPELYLVDVALIKADLSRYIVSSSDRSDLALPDKHALSIQAIKQDFVLRNPKPEYNLKAQVQRFLTRFCSLVLSSESASFVLPIFQDASFVIIPFTRPMSGSAAIISNGDEDWNYRGYPGGALFLILHDRSGGEDRDARLLELSRSLLWLLAESGMRESYARFFAEEQTTRAFLSYQITHPLKHRLGALNRQIERVSELRDQEGFPTALGRLEKTVKNTYRFAELAHILYHAALMGQRSPFRAEREAGILKFCTTDPLDLTNLLRKVFADQPVGRYQPQPVMKSQESTAAVVRAFAPGRDESEKVRLNDVFYEAVLQEVVQNVIAHGRRDERIDVIVRRDTVDDKDGLTLSNEVEASRVMFPAGTKEGEWSKWRSQSPSGLSFVADALALTGSGNLLFRCDRQSPELFLFSVALILEGLA